MTSQKQLKFAYSLAVHLLIVGIVCYVTFSGKVSEKPIRIMYKTNAGKVLFEHNTHSSLPGYGLACQDCHHHPDEDSSAMISCKNCHQEKVGENSIPKSCLDCHEYEDIQDFNILSQVDAFHDKCIQCHEDAESGPLDCSQCHVL